MSKRSDIHSPSKIVPANYEYVLSYQQTSSVGGETIPAYGYNCEIDLRVWEFDADGRRTKCTQGEHSSNTCCIARLNQSGATVVGCANKCTVCGAVFTYGDVWRHVGTGEYIHVGHTCVDKYHMLADRSAYELAVGRHAAAHAKELLRVAKAEARVQFLAKVDGLDLALTCNHPIVKDIAERFRQNGTLSEKQVALVLKLHKEAQNPAAKEKTITAPTGRQTFVGTVLSVKAYDSNYGTQMKATVKVTTPEGVWLAWGTLPAALLGTQDGARGKLVKITATLEQGKEPHFVFMKRPRGEFVEGAL